MKDISFIKNLNHLESLKLNDNNLIKDFKELKSLKGLISVNLSKTQFKNLSLIRSWESLKYLHLEGCRIKDWNAIEKFTNLECISLSIFKASNICYLKKLTKLRELNVNNTENLVIDLLKKRLPNVDVREKS